MKIIFPRLGEIAANRYTKIIPSVSVVTLMVHFYSLLKKSLSILLKGFKNDADDDYILLDSNALVGAPEDIIVHQRKLAAKQQEKISRLIEDPDSVQMSFLVWLSIMTILMPLHYSLFKRGGFFNQRDSTNEQDCHGCFHYCDLRRSPATKALRAISSMMCSGSDSEHARLLVLRFGREQHWPSALTTSIHKCLVAVYCRMWRLFSALAHVVPVEASCDI